MIKAGYDHHDFRAHISYSLGTLLASTGRCFRIACLCPRCGQVPQDLALFYGRKPPEGSMPGLQIVRSSFFGEGYLGQSSLPSEPLDRVSLDDLSAPVIYGTEAPVPTGWNIVSESEAGSHWIVERKGCYLTNIDLVASSFFELTRYEEIVRGQSSSLSEGSLPLRSGYLRDPPVNTYSQMIGKMLPPEREVAPPWPQRRKFAVCLTHDIDLISLRAALNWYEHDIRTYGLARLLPSLPLRGLRLVLRTFRNASPFWTFEEIADAEREFGFRSSFFFVVKDTPEPTGPDYEILRSQSLLALLDRLEKGGWEVGLHSLGGPMMRKEIGDLSSVGIHPASVRIHRLSMTVPKTWRHTSASGLRVDCSLGYNDDSGFRGGFCHPFFLFDAERGERLDTLELPLAVMDASYYWRRKKSASQAWSDILEIMDIVEENSGVLVILWHNNFFDHFLLDDWRKVYMDLLQEIARRKAYVACPRDIARHWIARMESLRTATTFQGTEGQPDCTGAGGE